jgi:hypothetical protein
MEKNATIVEQIKKLTDETNGDESELRKTSYVNGFKAAMAKVKNVITLIESIADDGK